MDYSFGDIGRTESRISDFPVESEFQECLKGIIRGQFREESGIGYLKNCEAFKMILKNILDHRNDERFKVIYIRNPRFEDTIGRYPAGLFLMELLGFIRVDDQNPFFMYCQENQYQLRKALSILENAQVKSQRFDEPKAKLNPEIKLRQIEEKNRELENQMKAHRDAQGIIKGKEKQDNVFPVKKPLVGKQITYAQLYKDPNLNNVEVVQNRDVVYQERKAFELSNDYRTQMGLEKLIWHDQIWAIAAEHSKNMASGAVAFGHDGFSERFKRFPFKGKKKGAENVGYYLGPQDPCVEIVNGWINSPGHRKNLVGQFRYMSVALIVSDKGFYYFTQLFAIN